MLLCYEFEQFWLSLKTRTFILSKRYSILPCVFLGFTRVFCSQSEWGSTQNVLMFMLYWREKISPNCTYLLPNTRSIHTVKNCFPPMTVHRFRVDPQWNPSRDVTWNPRIAIRKLLGKKWILEFIKSLLMSFHCNYRDFVRWNFV